MRSLELNTTQGRKPVNGTRRDREDARRFRARTSDESTLTLSQSESSGEEAVIEREPWWLRALAHSKLGWTLLVPAAALLVSGALAGLSPFHPLVFGTLLPLTALVAARVAVDLQRLSGLAAVSLLTALLAFCWVRMLAQLLPAAAAAALMALAVFVTVLTLRAKRRRVYLMCVAAFELAHQVFFVVDGPALVSAAVWLGLPFALALWLRPKLASRGSDAPAAPISHTWDEGAFGAWALSHVDPQTPASTLRDLHALLKLTLRQMRAAIDASSAFIFVADPDQQVFHLAEADGERAGVHQGPFPMGQGVLSAIMTSASLTMLTDLRRGFTGLTYRQVTEDIQHFVGLPLVDREKTQAILCVERTFDAAFTKRDIDVIEGAGAMLCAALRSERVFVELELSKREQRILYEASRTLSEARSLENVVAVAVDAAAQVTPFDVALLTRLDPRKKAIQTVVHQVGKLGDTLGGGRFSNKTALTQLAVEKRHTLPYRGIFDGEHQHVLGPDDGLESLRSVFIAPLIVRDAVLGTFVLGSAQPGLYRGSVLPTLQVLSNQLAVSVSNAEAVKRLEELATTDGLTGCLNKRAFLETLEQRLRAAGRFSQPLSLLVTDIDHFKRVNDTHGHATGDRVIKRLGELLRQLKRDTDAVARFGGEEFCVLCENTDAEGARLLAERVRERLEGCLFEAEKGTLNVTCSIGVATFPAQGKTPDALFEAADRALYSAKNAGRNQVICAA